jgi:hypothetical protein
VAGFAAAPFGSFDEAHTTQQQPQSLAVAIAAVNIDSWTVADVTKWLAGTVALPQYAPAFVEAAIDGELWAATASTVSTLCYCAGPMLLTLGDDDLSGLLNISAPLHRRKILMHAAKLAGKSAFEICGDYKSIHTPQVRARL